MKYGTWTKSTNSAIHADIYSIAREGALNGIERFEEEGEGTELQAPCRRRTKG